MLGPSSGKKKLFNCYTSYEVTAHFPWSRFEESYYLQCRLSTWQREEYSLAWNPFSETLSHADLLAIKKATGPPTAGKYLCLPTPIPMNPERTFSWKLLTNISTTEPTSSLTSLQVSKSDQLSCGCFSARV